MKIGVDIASLIIASILTAILSYAVVAGVALPWWYWVAGSAIVIAYLAIFLLSRRYSLLHEYERIAADYERDKG